MKTGFGQEQTDIATAKDVLEPVWDLEGLRRGNQTIGLLCLGRRLDTIRRRAFNHFHVST